MMKRGKTDQFKSAVVQYMRRRNYPESEIQSRKIQLTDVDEMSVRKRSRISAGVENNVSCCSIVADLTSCDAQFARLRKFVLESSSQQNEELSALLFPVFVHMYAGLVSVGPKTSAHKFHERHWEVFHTEQQKDFIRSLRKLESKAELQAARDIMNFIDHRHTVRLSHGSISQLLKHLQATNNMIILQIINQHVNLVGCDTRGKGLDLQANSSASHITSSKGAAVVGEKRDDKDCVRKDLQRREVKEERGVVGGSHHHSSAQSSTTPVPPTTTTTTTAAAAIATAASTLTTNSTTAADDAYDPSSELSPLEREELSRLDEAGVKLEGVACPLPSIVFHTVINASAHQGLCTSTISPDLRLLSGGFEDSSVHLYRLQPMSLPTAPTDCDNSRLTLAADYIVKDEAERRLEVDVGTDEGVTLRAHNGPVYKTQFTPDSSHLLSCSRDCTVRLWSLSTRTNMAIYRGHSSSVWDLDYCPATNHFVSSSRDLTVKLWSLDRVFPLRSFIGHQMDIQAVALHPNGNYLASGSMDKTVRLWDIQDGRCLRVLCAHRGSVLTLAFSPNGLMLASAGDDRRVYVWDLNSGTVMRELRGHTDTVYSLTFSPCSDLLASGGHDSVIRLWDVRKGAENRGTASLIEGHTSPELMGAYPTKSATVSCLSFPHAHLMNAVGTSQ